MKHHTIAGLALSLAGSLLCSGAVLAGMSVPVSAPTPSTTVAPVEAAPAPAVPAAEAPAAVPVPVAPAKAAAATTTIPPLTKVAPVAAPVTTTTLPLGTPPPPPSSEGSLNDANRLLGEGKKYEARAILTKLILAAPEGPARENLRRTLDTINAEIFYNPSVASPDCATQYVQRTLANICSQNKKDIYFARLLMKINHISDEKRVRANQKLKVPQGRFSAIVQKHAHRLIIVLNDQYIKEYPVALGAPATPTPEGRFVLDNNKMINPDWYAPEGRVYHYGEPENILGTRWLGFKEADGRRGFGIHGTSDPASVGTDASNGCIRMNNADVEEVFSMLMPDDVVTIVK